MDFRICLAPKYYGYSISVQSYELYPHLAQLDIIDVTMSHIHTYLLADKSTEYLVKFSINYYDNRVKNSRPGDARDCSPKLFLQSLYRAFRPKRFE